MCFGIFKKKVEIAGMPTVSKQVVIEELENDILIHEQWAVLVTQTPSLAVSFGDYDWHLHWIAVYKNAIYYLNGGV